MKVKDLLVIAYSFPPCSVTGTFRTLAFVKYLEPIGWRSTVLSAANPVFPERDGRLLAQIPVSTRVVRTLDHSPLERLRGISRPLRSTSTAGTASTRSDPSPTGPWRAFKLGLALRLQPPGRTPGWYSSTVRAAQEMLKERLPDAIYSSGPPWTAHLVGLRLARQFGIPWVADFRDPWLENPFVDVPLQVLRKRDVADERKVADRADVLLCVLSTMQKTFLERYPNRSESSVQTILNGFDPELFESVRPSVNSNRNELTLLHAGQFYGPRRVEPIMHALRELNEANARSGFQARLRLLGGPSGHAAELRTKVEKLGGATFVEVEKEIPHHEALKEEAKAGVLLLIGFTGPGEQFQMSAKIFEYLAVRRPILALAPPAGPVGEVLRASGVRHWIVSPNDQTGILNAMKEIVTAWRGGELDGPQSTSSLAEFDRREQAKRLAQILDGAIAARAR